MEIYFLAVLFLLAASFIKCLVDSQINIEFFTRRSRCDSCQKELGFFELIPIYSYIKQKARC
ncbi:prepilin peptidase, partial [Streptococcus danieliae]|nr:prepilin peptidase [Streptococcus danieliae]